MLHLSAWSSTLCLSVQPSLSHLYVLGHPSILSLDRECLLTTWFLFGIPTDASQSVSYHLASQQCFLGGAVNDCSHSLLRPKSSASFPPAEIGSFSFSAGRNRSVLLQ